MARLIDVAIIFLLCIQFLDSLPVLASDSGEINVQVSSPVFSHTGGFYPDPLSLTIACPTPGAIIYYSTDGSEPAGFMNGHFIPSYDQSPILLDSTTVIRSRAFKTGSRPSSIVTQTYFINEQSTLPIVSIATDPRNLWDKYHGIYVSGSGRNFEKKWEKPAHLELFETPDIHGFSLDIGLRIHGGWSRRLPQKSLAIFARRQYGSNRIEYPLFPDKPVSSFKSFVLRNSGNDWTSTLFRDAMMQTLVKQRMEIDYQDYRPVLVFLNGTYWGIYNLREKMNEHYIESNYGIDSEKVDLLKGKHIVMNGDANHYRAMIQFLESNDITRVEVFDHLQKFLDVDEFINYQISQIYFANTDWFDENIKCWRQRDFDGRWRWMLFDTDYGFNLPLALTPSPPDHNTLKQAMNSFLFKKILDNTTFRNEFIQRFASHLNTTFHPERVIHIIDSLKTRLEPEIPRHIERWKSFPAPYYGNIFQTIEKWESNVEDLKYFARQRPNNVRRHLSRKFGLETPVTVHVEGNPNTGGKIRIHGAMIDSLPWSGSYFPKIPIRFSALSLPGRVFSGWSEVNFGDSSTAIVDLSDNLKIKVGFGISTLPNIVFSEINYHSHQISDSGDWVELYNPGVEPIDISGWQFMDTKESHNFVLPENTLVRPNSYIVLCQDSEKYRAQFPELTDCIGDFAFGLSNGGELIRLYNSVGAIIDSLTYDDHSPWPMEPDGTGSTLALATSAEDKGSFRGWASANATPGGANDLHDTSIFRVSVSSPRVLAENDRIYLSWIADVEIQNKGFIIYRSVNEDNFVLVNSYEKDVRLEGRPLGTSALRYVWVDEDMEFGNRFSYLLSSMSIHGDEKKFSDQIISTEIPVESERIVDRSLLNYPNPFRLKTFLDFKLTDESSVFLTIYNVRGEKIRTFIKGDLLDEGKFLIEWDGRNQNGRFVSSGTYFAVLKSSNFSMTRKMLLIK